MHKGESKYESRYDRHGSELQKGALKTVERALGKPDVQAKRLLTAQDELLGLRGVVWFTRGVGRRLTHMHVLGHCDDWGNSETEKKKRECESQHDSGLEAISE